MSDFMKELINKGGGCLNICRKRANICDFKSRITNPSEYKECDKKSFFIFVNCINNCEKSRTD